jgi:hypothetical protein
MRHKRRLLLKAVSNKLLNNRLLSNSRKAVRNRDSMAFSGVAAIRLATLERKANAMAQQHSI